MAEHLSVYSDFSTVALALHAARLDCLLEAALSGFTLDLITPSEEREAWWWIYSITKARSDLALRRTWQAEWARSWSFIALGMKSVSRNK